MRHTPALAAVIVALSVSPALSAVGEIDAVTPTVSGADQGIAGLATGPNGNLWFTMPGSRQVVRMNPQTHAVTQFDLSAAICNPQGIALGPDAAMWFGCQDGAIGRISTAGAVTYYAVGELGPAGQGTFAPVNTVLTGPGGKIWFAQFSTGIVGIVSPATGLQKRVRVQPAPRGGLTVGGDGNVWATNLNQGSVSTITPAGRVSELPISAQVASLATAANGEVWGPPLTGSAIQVVAPAGAVRQLPFGAAVATIARGPLGYMWLGDATTGSITRVAADGASLPFTAGVAWNPSFRAVAAGADGNMWFAGAADPSGRATLFRVATGAVPTNLVPPTLSGSATAGSTLTADPGAWTYAPTGYAYRWERCTTATGGCVVIAGASGTTYTVTSADAGRWLRVGVVATNRSGPSSRAWSRPLADGDAIVPGGPIPPGPGTYVGPVALGLDTLLSTRVVGANVITRYRVAEPGHFSQSARAGDLRLCGSSRNIAAAGTYTATCRLPAAARAALRTRAIRASVTSTYTRRGLPTAVATVKVTIPRSARATPVVG